MNKLCLNILQALFLYRKQVFKLLENSLNERLCKKFKSELFFLNITHI